MADLSYIDAAQEVKIVGQDATGNRVNFVGADSNGNMLSKDFATSATGSAVPSNASFTAGKNPSGNLQALSTDASGRLFVNLFDNAGNGLSSQANGAQRALDGGIDGAGIQIDPRQCVVDVTSLPSAATNGTFDTPNADPFGNQISISETYAYTRFGQMFMVSSGLLSSGSSSEKAYFYFRNASGNTKSVRIKRIILAGPNSGTTNYKFYKNPTITANGTALTITGARQTGQASPQATCFTLPTASSMGTLFRAINVPTGSSFILDLDYSLWIEPNNSILITANQSLIGGLSGVDIDFVEE